MKLLFLLGLFIVVAVSLTDKQIIQLSLNGIFEENKLPYPVTIVRCLDNPTAHKVVLFIGDVLEKAAKGGVSDLISLVEEIQNFKNQIPQQVKDCLNGNAELAALGKKYGINETTDIKVVQRKVIAYITLHYIQVHITFGNINASWKSSKPYQTGFDFGVFGHKILGISRKEIAAARNLENKHKISLISREII